MSIPEMMSWYNEKLSKETKNQISEEIKALSQCDDDFMMAFDATSLYPSAMWDAGSEFPDITSARPFKPSEEQEVLDLFNSQTFRPRTGFFKIQYYNPPELFLQHVPVKETIEKENGKTLEASRFRNGRIIDHLNSVDIQEIVRVGGVIERIYEGVIYEKNLDESPFRSYIENLFALRKKYKEEGNKVGDELIKLLLNSLYGKTVQKDIVSSIHVWSTKTLQDNYDDLIMARWEIKPGMWLVQRKKETEAIDVTKNESRSGILNKEKKSSDVPHHLGSFILAHSRRIMNNFILAIDGFKTPNVAYSDTDSIYIKKSLYEKLDALGCVGGDLCKGKNDYGSGGIVYGLYLAPKVKYNIVLNDGVLSEKKTFKGLNKTSLKSKDFFTLACGGKVTTKVPTPWKRDFKNGVRIPDPVEEVTKKEFNPEINLLKRRAPDENGIMRPYYIDNPTKVVPITIDTTGPRTVLLPVAPQPVAAVPPTVVHEVLVAEPSDIFKTCNKCKEAKSHTDYYESHKSWCKKCINKNHCDWLRRNPNAVVAESFRTRIRNKEDIEQLTGLKSSEFKRWLEFTKRFYIPRVIRGR
jgi:hypothetical protein